MNREQQIVEAGMRYQAALESGLVNINTFVLDYPEDIRQELRDFLEFSLLIGEPEEPIVLTADEQALIARVTQRRAGRPPLHSEPMESHSLMFTAEQWRKVQERGGAAYVRRLIDADT